MKIICIGRNYTDHIEELSNERPKDPVIFIKPDSAVLPKEQDFYRPEFSSDIHYEVELLVKIHKVGKHIAKEFAPNYYDEIGLGIDFTARDLQSQLKEKGLPWEKSKGFDGSAVIGKWVSKAQFENLENIGNLANLDCENVGRPDPPPSEKRRDVFSSRFSKFSRISRIS
ncbi:MAG: fumarylacetoacetate hydrolase family protein, partial [Flavobacteriaceae bacterium]